MSDALAAGITGAAATHEVARIRSLEERAGAYARASRAENTLHAYRSDLRDFEQWCTDHRRRSLPATPDTLTLYLTALAEPAPGPRPSSAASPPSPRPTSSPATPPRRPTTGRCARPCAASAAPWAPRPSRRRPLSPPSCAA
jgi:hypothetical protein